MRAVLSTDLTCATSHFTWPGVASSTSSTCPASYSPLPPPPPPPPAAAESAVDAEADRADRNRFRSVKMSPVAISASAIEGPKLKGVTTEGAAGAGFEMGAGTGTVLRRGCI